MSAKAATVTELAYRLWCELLDTSGDKPEDDSRIQTMRAMAAALHELLREPESPPPPLAVAWKELKRLVDLWHSAAIKYPDVPYENGRSQSLAQVLGWMRAKEEGRA